MSLPRQFELVIAPSGASAMQMTGAINNAGSIQALLTTVSGAMDATDAAVSGCAAMAPTDITTWQALYSAWQAWAKTLSDCLSNVPPDQYAPPDVQCISSFGLNWAAANSQLQSYQKDTVTWQNRVKAACPSFKPSPTPAPPGPSDPGPGPGPAPGPQTSWLCSTFGINCGGSTPADSAVGWPDAIKWGAILGLGLLAAWYVGPFIATVAGVGAGAVRKRASGRDEFEPVAMFKRGSGNFSFGNMDVEAPKIEPLQFGDIPRDEILALIGGKE